MPTDFFMKMPQKGGPGIFSSRLKDELIKQGLVFNPDSRNRVSIISGKYKDGCNNILRLDGLYFNDAYRRNKGIFECYREFDHIVFQSRFCKVQYETFTGWRRPHSIISNGVEDEFFERRNDVIKPAKPRVIASSAWRRHKRLSEIIESFKSPRLRNVDLWVLGGKSKYDKGVTPNIFLFGYLPHAVLPRIYQSCTAMIHLAWLDWCPNTVVEGLAAGLPVLCSHNGGTKELVGNDGIVLKLEEDYVPGTQLDHYKPPEVDTNTIVEGVLRLIEMPAIQARDDLRISHVARKYRETFIHDDAT